MSKSRSIRRSWSEQQASMKLKRKQLGLDQDTKVVILNVKRPPKQPRWSTVNTWRTCTTWESVAPWKLSWNKKILWIRSALEDKRDSMQFKKAVPLLRVQTGWPASWGGMWNSQTSWSLLWQTMGNATTNLEAGSVWQGVDRLWKLTTNTRETSDVVL